MKYFVYVPELVAVETDLDSFKWNLGADPPEAGREEYDRCKVRIHLCVVDNKDVPVNADGADIFRRFSGRRDAGDIAFSQRMFKLFDMRFSISVSGNEITAVVGKSYFRRIKYKIMNVHPIWYILFDLTTLLLLREGLLPVYCSAVKKDDAASLIMAPPNMGKSFTALSLSQKHGFGIISEDIAVTDGERVWPVPWTDTFRDYGEELEKSRKEADKVLSTSEIKNVFLLGRGEGKVKTLDDPFEKMMLLNRYDIRYYCSPALLALNYFNGELSLEASEKTEREIIKKLIRNCSVYSVDSEDAAGYCDLISGSVG